MTLVPVTSGHDAIYLIDIAVPGTFVEIAQVTNDLNFSVFRATSHVSAHKASVDVHVVSDLLQRGLITGTMNFVDGPTQDEITGLLKAVKENIEFNLQIQGPDHIPGSQDEITTRGRLTAFNRTWPIDAGVQAATFSFRPTGLFVVNFTQFNKTGLIIISAPINGDSFPTASNPISFAGKASDINGVDETANLAWTSDIDGAIGAGGSFTFTLSIATHVITAAAPVVGSFSITITITP